MFAVSAAVRVAVFCYCISLLLIIVEAAFSHSCWYQGSKSKNNNSHFGLRSTIGSSNNNNKNNKNHHHERKDYTISPTTRTITANTKDTTYPIIIDRRSVVRWGLISLSTIINNNKAVAGQEEDLTTQLYNPDGSLKVDNSLGVILPSSVQTRTITIDFSTAAAASSTSKDDTAADTTTRYRQVSIDGILQTKDDTTTSSSFTTVRATYQLPAKWTTTPTTSTTTISPTNGYYDTRAASSSYAKSCDRIVVYQQYVGGGEEGAMSSSTLLDRASTVGISKTLQLEDSNGEWTEADLLSARRTTKQGNDDEYSYKYYYYDLANAPKVCDTTSATKASENLGLGFCPYDRIECTKDEWKCCNSDLKRIRDSFTISTTTTDESKF